jgi:dihydrofolate reductase
MSEKRRILLDLAVTLDGFIEGKNGEIDWCIMEPEMNFPDFLNQIDTVFFDRKSYELFGAFRPKEDSSLEDKDMWAQIDEKKKYVFSRTLQSTQDFTVIKNHLTDEIEKIRNMPGKDIWLYGGSELIATFMKLNLIDEYRLSIHPVLLRDGKPLFTDTERLGLELIKVNTYPSGVVQLIYHRESPIAINQNK